jgi:hypothetical protein
VTATTEKEEGNVKIFAEHMRSAEDLFKQVKRVTLDVHPDNKDKMALLRQWIEKNPGDAALTLRLHLPELKHLVELELKDIKGVQASTESLDGLMRLGISLGLH